MKTNQLVVAVASLGFILASCGGSKTAPRKVYEAPQGTVSVELPCTGTLYQSDKKHIRATGDQISAQSGVATVAATSQAKQKIASDIQSRVQNVLDNYFKITGVEAENITVNRIESMSRQTSNNVLGNTITICNKLVRIVEEGVNKGKYQAFVTQEISLENIVNEVSSLLNEAKVDYDYEKFKETFEMEMSKN